MKLGFSRVYRKVTFPILFHVSHYLKLSGF